MKGFRYGIMVSFFCACLYSSAVAGELPFTISGYAEIYHAYDFSRPSGNTRPDFLYSFARHNEVSLNFGMIKASYQDSSLRGNIAFMTGSYANANLADEPGVLKNIFEANIGVKLSQSANIWLDAGIMPSHIGFESAIGADCFNLTRGILAENSPYYETGAKLSYTTDDGVWFIGALVLNGWQRIQRPDGQTALSFGHELTYSPSSSFSLNSSSFIGSDTPDSARQMRYFHNFFGEFHLSENFSLILGFDIGAQERLNENGYDVWYSPVASARVRLSEDFALGLRAEYYSDEHNIIVENPTATRPFRVLSGSANIDYTLSAHALARVECRFFSSQDEIFITRNGNSSTNVFIASSLSWRF